MRKENGYERDLSKESATQGKVTVSVHLTRTQKTALKEIIRDWGVDMAQVGRRLVRHLIDNKVSLMGLLQKYQAGIAGKKITYKLSESRNHRICIRLLHEEKQKLDESANEWFYLPGELARIMFELFIMGIIEKNDIWE